MYPICNFLSPVPAAGSNVKGKGLVSKICQHETQTHDLGIINTTPH